MSERIGLIAGREAWLREWSGWLISASQKYSMGPWWHEGTWSDTRTQYFPDRQTAIDHAEKYRTKLAKGQVWELSTGEQGEATEYRESSGRWLVGRWWCNADGTMPVVPHRLTRLISEPEPAPVVDLMTAPHGSQWLCRDGSIYTHGCWLEGLAAEDKAVGVREGTSVHYYRHGNYLSSEADTYDIIGPCIEPPRPRTKTVWLEWWERVDSSNVSGVSKWYSEESLRKAMVTTVQNGCRTIATGTAELVEGEGCA
jgi:hypothetical protein